MVYQIKLAQFEGPLHLLLSLIEEQKMDVTKVSLASVADQYLEYVSQKEDITLDNLAEFLSVASKLILIKSKALLPVLELTDEEEKEIKDLEQQLVEYKKFKDVSVTIGKIWDSPRVSFARESFLGYGSFFYAPDNVNVFDLKKAFVRVLDAIPNVEKLEEEMVRDIVTLEEKINSLRHILQERVEASFGEIVADAKDKIEVIVSFLAMLELVKQRIIAVEQEQLFEEIQVRVRNN